MASVVISNIDTAAIDDLKTTAARLAIPPGELVSRLLGLHHALEFAASTSAEQDVREFAATLLRGHQLGR